MPAPTRQSPLEPTATNRATWDRKAAERINALLALCAALEARVKVLEEAT